MKAVKIYAFLIIILIISTTIIITNDSQSKDITARSFYLKDMTPDEVSEEYMRYMNSHKIRALCCYGNSDTLILKENTNKFTICSK
jgi:hypothetical protein